MSSLIELKGTPVDARSLPTYTWNADLIDFDGPLLSLFKTDEGQDVLFSWIDCDKKMNRWCIVPIHRELLWNYLNEKVTLRSVFLEATRILVFHSGKDSKRRRFLSIESLPDAYLPESDSFLRPEISTSAAKRLIADTPQDKILKLNGELYLDDLAGIPKLYQQLYSFHYGLEHLARPAVRGSVERLMSQWRGGIGAVNLFSGLKSVTPSIHRARLLQLQYNSPGFIRLSLLPKLARQIGLAMEKIESDESFLKSENLYREIYKYFKDHKIAGLEDERSLLEKTLLPHQVNALQGYVERFISVMGWESYQNDFNSLQMSAVSQLRMLCAYYRRIRKLREFVTQGKLEV